VNFFTPAWATVAADKSSSIVACDKNLIFISAPCFFSVIIIPLARQISLDAKTRRMKKLHPTVYITFMLIWQGKKISTTAVCAAIAASCILGYNKKNQTFLNPQQEGTLCHFFFPCWAKNPSWP
jgi:hypothetical protein